MNYLRNIRWVVLFLGAYLPLSAQISGDFKPDAPLPVDPLVITDTLNNGLRYYIKVNRKPENRAELRLALNAGSVLEDDDQQGLAHFCEHMAFNGTQKYRRQEIVDYLESIGMRFGPEINAYTGSDETVYMLEVPTEDKTVMEKAFQILGEWAQNVAFEPVEIDKERGVIIEEWRLGQGADSRMFNKQIPVLFKGSKYAVRLPIGQKAVIDTFHHESLLRFYRDWYRPDLMAIVAVGDFDAGWIRDQIQKWFGNFPAPASSRQRSYPPVPDHDETLFAIATDPEAARSEIGIYYKYELKPERTAGEYRRMIVENIYDRMVNQRLEELLHQADPPFIYAFSGRGRFVRTKGVYFVTAGTKEDGILKGLDALLTEVERVRKFGFITSELERMKKELGRSIERAFLEREKTESRSYAAEYIRNYLTEEPIPGIEYEYNLFNKVIPGILLEEINALAQERLTEKNRVIMLNAPEKPGLAIPGESELLAVFDRVKRKDLIPYSEELADQPIVRIPPVPGHVIKEKQMSEVGVTEWILSNGIRVVMKPTDFKNDEIRFTSFSPGGHSRVADREFVSSVAAPMIVREGGLGAMDKITLDKILAGRQVSVSPYISALMEGLTGSSSVRDLEVLFQLVHLYFTAPRRDSTAFLSYKARLKGFIENRSVQPETAFQDTLTVTLGDYHFRSRPWSDQVLDEIDLETAFRVYKDRFADAGDFTFFFAGNVRMDTLKMYAEQYLGSLPSPGRNETWKDTGMEIPQGIIRKTVRKGIEPKSMVRMVFSGEYQWSRQNNYDLESLVSVLEIKLREIIREDLSGTYGVTVWSSQSHYPKERYSVQIGFGCQPERVEALIQSVLTQLDSVKSFGIDASYISKVQEIQRRDHETSLRENSFWLGALSFACINRENPADILDYTKLVGNLDSEDIRSAAARYLNGNNYIQVVLMPENQAQTDVR